MGLRTFPPYLSRTASTASRRFTWLCDWLWLALLVEYALLGFIAYVAWTICTRTGPCP